MIKITKELQMFFLTKISEIKETAERDGDTFTFKADHETYCYDNLDIVINGEGSYDVISEDNSFDRPYEAEYSDDTGEFVIKVYKEEKLMAKLNYDIEKNLLC